MPNRRMASHLLVKSYLLCVFCIATSSYAFNALTYAIYANVSERLSEAPRIAKRFLQGPLPKKRFALFSDGFYFSLIQKDSQMFIVNLRFVPHLFRLFNG